MTSLVSTSRYWVSHPSPEYTLQWSQLGCAVTRPAPTALCLAQATLSLRPTPMALRRRHTFLDMQYECDTSKAARGTGADLSIHRLEPTVAQRPYTAVGTSPCSRNPFSPSGVLLNSSACVNLACRRESGTWCARLSSDSRRHEGCVVQRNGVCRWDVNSIPQTRIN